jgi:two-component system response regulator (stage 0 sporulation protein F)
MSKQHVVRVLIVDDDRGLRELLEIILTEEGYTVSQAANGLRALEILEEVSDHLVVLLDLRMPGLSGDRVLEIVEGDQRLQAEHAFVVITANSRFITPDLAERMQRLRVPVVAKPFDMDTLLGAISDVAQRFDHA